MDYSCGKVDDRDPVAIDKAQSEIDAGRRMVSGTFVMLIVLLARDLLMLALFILDW